MIDHGVRSYMIVHKPTTPNSLSCIALTVYMKYSMIRTFKFQGEATPTYSYSYIQISYYFMSWEQLDAPKAESIIFSEKL